MDRDIRYIAVLVACSIFTLPGCDTVSRHKVLSTIFDGVPTLPPPEQICEEYAVKRIAQFQGSLLVKTTSGPAAKTSAQSLHAPYEEKKCDDCHDKEREGGFRYPKQELCFVCHKGFIKGEYVHGPVAVGSCLTCHEPHSAKFPKLLKFPSDRLCGTCHREKRVAAGLHAKMAARQIGCTDCHDPHYGNAHFFLK